MMGPFFIVLIGFIFLLRTLEYVTPHTADVVWPIVLMCFGFQKMVGHSCKCRAKH